jgi:hypothetical protein
VNPALINVPGGPASTAQRPTPLGRASGVAQNALYSAGNAWSCGPFGAAGPAATGTRRLAGPRREAQDELGCGENTGVARPSAGLREMAPKSDSGRPG